MINWRASFGCFLVLFVLSADVRAGEAALTDAKLAREEKLESLLTSLEIRCGQMHSMQLGVLNGVANISMKIDANPDKKPNAADKAAARKLAAQMKDIIAQADKSIKILEDEGAAVAFPEVFKQLRDDMVLLQGRLERCELDKKTHVLQRNIIDTLDEMVSALKKPR